MLAFLLTVLLAACDPLGSAYEECLQRLDLSCECGDTTYNPSDPYVVCDFTEEDRERTCAEYKEGEPSAEAMAPMMGCFNRALRDCEIDDDEQTECAELAPEE